MGQPIDSVPSGISDSAGVPTVAKITANTRVRATTGPIGILTDVPQFPGAPTLTGLWTLGAMRCRINGLPVIHAASVGIGISVVGSPTGPLQLTLSDSKVKAL